MQLVLRNPQIMDNYLSNEVVKGNILGPFQAASVPAVHINRLGAIPKKHQVNKWTIITDLLHPKGLQCE